MCQDQNESRPGQGPGEGLGEGSTRFLGSQIQGSSSLFLGNYVAGWLRAPGGGSSGAPGGRRGILMGPWGVFGMPFGALAGLG